MTRFALIFLCLLILSCQEKVETNKLPQWVDLSYAYDNDTPFWPTAEGFNLDTVSYGVTPSNFFYSAFKFQTAEHGGTHIDAPIHFAEGKKSVDEIPLDQLIGEAIVIDVTKKCKEDIDYQISAEDLIDWEKENGAIPDQSIVLFRTGFGSYWPDKLKYMGTDQKGPAAVLLLHFPGLDPDATSWLVENRTPKAVGIDTPSIDYGRSSSFLTHRILMERDIPAFENLANLDLLPFTGFEIIALPMKIRGGSGGPLRIVAKI